MYIGLALSGGGVRGAAHIGVLKALEEAGIKPKLISGASAGSIVASLYSIGYKPKKIEEIFLSIGKGIVDYDFKGLIAFTTGMIMRKKVKIDGFVRGDKLEKLISELCAKKGIMNIASTKIPLAITSVDINTSETVIFSSVKLKNEDGIVYDNTVKISEAVRSSASFPGIFKPKIIGDRRLVDGGVRDNVPARVLKLMGAEKVIAVNLGYCGEHEEYIDNVLEISVQTIDIMAYSIFKYQLKDIDYLIKPKIYNVKLLDTEKISECIERGYTQTKAIIGDLKSKLGI